MFEANGALVPIDFQLINTGTPRLDTIEFVSIAQVVTPNGSTGDWAIAFSCNLMRVGLGDPS